MINHARTLLLNINGNRYQPQYLGEEYIPANFAAVNLPSYIQAARRILFGARPERVFLNYRVRELLHTVHETELNEYLYALDPRVTYWPEPTPVFFNQRKHVRIEKTTTANGLQLFLSGNFNADNAVGLAQREYTVRTQRTGSDDYIVIEYENNVAPKTIQKVATASGLSSAVNVAGTNLQVRVGGSVIPTSKLLLETGHRVLTELLQDVVLETVVGESDEAPVDTFGGNAWRLTSFAPPASVVSLIPLLEVMGEPNLLELFGVSNYDQPYATFKNLWFDHPLAAYRLAGFTMALIYRTEEIRRGQNG